MRNMLWLLSLFSFWIQKEADGDEEELIGRSVGRVSEEYVKCVVKRKKNWFEVHWQNETAAVSDA